jgi:hypothetical protein
MPVINRHRGVLVAVLALVLVSLLFSGCAERGTHPAQEPRYQSAINDFVKRDQQNPPPKGAILFIGSSIFRQWANLQQQMQPLPVFNRAFGGSQTADILFHMDKIVLPYEPRIIVYYCGSNDVNAARGADGIAGRFFEFVSRVKEKLPDTRIFYVSIIRAPQKRDRWDVVDSTNAMVAAFCSRTDRLAFIDVNPAFFDKGKNPRVDLFQKDQLHLVDTAYVEMAAIIRPVIARAWETK